MNLHYYLSLFPIEAFIASNLDPARFGSYMATGSKVGSYEDIMFIETDGGFGTAFDWEYATKQCVPHQNGDPKNSLYLSVYRTLENVPLSALRSLFLTTRNGRTLEIGRSELPTERKQRPYWVYQELCPIRPLAVSTLRPEDFAGYMTDPANKTWVPKIVFADLKIPKPNPITRLFSAPLYAGNFEHLDDCIRSVTELKSKRNKIVDRFHVDRFVYGLIDGGVYVGDGGSIVHYPMKPVEEIRKRHRDWGRSARLF